MSQWGLVSKIDGKIQLSASARAAIDAVRSEDDAVRWAKIGLRVAEAALPGDSHYAAHWSLWDDAVEHVEALAEQAERWSADIPRAAWLLDRASVYLRNDGDPERAIVVSRQAVELAEQGRMAPTQKSVLLVNLAYAHADLGELNEAKRLFEQALDIEREAVGEAPEYAVTLSNYGNILRRMELYLDAERAQRKAVEVLERQPGVDPTRLGEALNDLGLTLNALEKVEEAVDVLERAVDVFDGGYGTDKAKYNHAMALADLGWAEADLEKMRDAASELNEVAEMQRQLYPHPSRQLALTLHVLADIRREIGHPDTDEAQQEALALADELGINLPLL